MVTGEQASKRASEQASKRAIEQSSNRATEHTTNRTTSSSVRCTVVRSFTRHYPECYVLARILHVLAICTWRSYVSTLSFHLSLFLPFLFFFSSTFISSTYFGNRRDSASLSRSVARVVEPWQMTISQMKSVIAGPRHWYASNHGVKR